MSPSKARTRRRLSAVVSAIAIWVGTVALALPAAAAPGDLVLASTSDAGVKGNGGSFGLSPLSADGSAVAFASGANNLDPADTDVFLDIYVKDLAGGDIVLASTSDTGIKSNRDSFDPSLSPDGSTVAFVTYASNLDPADRDSFYDVYVKDLASGNIVLASAPSPGGESREDAREPSLSADGRTVAFSTGDRLVPADTNSDPDIYVRNLASGDVVLASTSDTGIAADLGGSDPALSADGRTVAFSSQATNLDPADPNSGVDIYVKNLTTGDISLASANEAGVTANSFAYEPSLSGDGGTVAFLSGATNLDPADTAVDQDVYVKDLTNGEVTLASTSDVGANPFGFANSPAMSADGDVVAFTIDASLDPADRNREVDVYVKDLTSGDITLASTSASNVSANAGSFAPAMAAEGRTVAFESAATNLDPADRDGVEDVYVKSLPIPVAASVGNSVQVEGDTGLRLTLFPVTLDRASPNPVKVGFATGRGTATAGTDYVAMSGTLTFAPGETSKFIAVRIIGDVDVEPLETFAVQLSNPSGGDGTGIGAIVNDD